MKDYNYNPNNHYNDIIDNDSDICIELPNGYSKPWVTLPKDTYNKLTFLKKRGMLTEREYYSTLIKFALWYAYGILERK